MKRTGAKATYAAPAIEKAFEVLELLVRWPEGALVSEMAADLGRSVGELFRIVVVMEQLGYLKKSQTTDRYTVTYKLLDLAFRATPSQDIVRAALPEMQVLAIEAGQSCHLVVPNGGSGMVVAREEQPGTRGFALKVGARIDIVRSCSGQVILAFSNDQRGEQIVRAAESERGIAIDRAWLAERKSAIRAAGFDLRKSPITHGVTDISFPIFGFDREIVAALTIPFLELIDGSQKVHIDAARDLLRAATARVSDRLGYQPDAG
ncbi:IclR family transcriptional regulator [Sphingomonas sp. H39-1-10]|uniref:IclR family transcriptional regulator n=1 Tax=Sphingomonas pollutisoli TaxID=3030829 RepID=UPI0023B9805C|nr:IclR family transcriptional regulator [Sphingomonas pollutisoli]MDF0489305.1 IclR family transcriptional regulator [Sphingomonas pollutisoli]